MKIKETYNLFLSQSKLARKTFHLLVSFVLLFALYPNESKGQVCSVNAGLNGVTCQNDSLKLRGNYSGSFQGGTKPHWTLVSSPANATVNLVPTDSFNFLKVNQPGLYTFKYSGFCSDGVLASQTVNWTVYPITQAVATVDDSMVCPKDTLRIIHGNQPGLHESGAWSVVQNDGGVIIYDLTNPNSPIGLSSNKSGICRLVWTIVDSTGWCYSHDEIQIVNRGGVAIVNAGNDITLSPCYTTKASTALNGSYAGEPLYQQMSFWTYVTPYGVKRSPTFSDITKNNSTVSFLDTGVYIFTWHVAGPCASGTDDVKIIVPKANALVTNPTVTPTNQFRCATIADSLFTLTATGNLAANEVGTWSFVSGTDNLFQIYNPSAKVTSVKLPTLNGSWTFKWTITNSNTGCSKKVNTTITKAAPPTVKFAPIRDTALPCDEVTVSIPYSLNAPGTTKVFIKCVDDPYAGAVQTYPLGYTQILTNPFVWQNLNRNGKYKLRFLAVGPNNGCPIVYDSTEVSIEISRHSSGANAGTDQVVPCDSDRVDLAGNIPFGDVALGINGEWSKIYPQNIGVTFSSINNPNAMVPRPAVLWPTDSFAFVWTIYAGLTCPIHYDTVGIRIKPRLDTFSVIICPDTVFNYAGVNYQLRAGAIDTLLFDYLTCHATRLIVKSKTVCYRRDTINLIGCKNDYTESINLGCDAICSNYQVTTYHYSPHNDTTTIDLVRVGCYPNTSTTAHLTNKYNCDSVVITNIVYTPHPDTTTLNLVRVGCYANTTTTVHLTNQYNCDSVVITNVVYTPHNDTTTFDLVRVGCYPNTSTTAHLTNKYNCDSVVITNVVYTPHNDTTTFDLVRVGCYANTT
ncbi:MAG: hypothetical protein ORN56_02915, partial [Chitinophagales bacterium]|nr:hypothetical protein [Chitinophagales bacterium]